MADADLNVQTIVSQMFGQNCFVLSVEGRADCLVIDPGLDAGKIIKTLQQKELTPSAVLNTHGHMDHVAGNEAIKEQWPDCPIIIGHKEAEKLTDPSKNLSRDFGLPMTSPPADRLVSEGDTFEGAGVSLEVVEAPGHSAGHVVYVWKGGAPWIAFCGDVLFRGSVGRSDFPDSNPSHLFDSIRIKLYSLPDDTIVLPGHGEATTIGQEKQTNPFVRP